MKLLNVKMAKQKLGTSLGILQIDENGLVEVEDKEIAKSLVKSGFRLLNKDGKPVRPIALLAEDLEDSDEDDEDDSEETRKEKTSESAEKPEEPRAKVKAKRVYRRNSKE